MKPIIFITFALIAFTCAFKEDSDWKEWKKNHKKTFKDDDHEEKRFKNFKKRDDEFKAHNEKFKKGEVFYTLGHNEYSDLDEEELKKYFPLIPPMQTSRSLPQINYWPSIFPAGPTSIDFRAHCMPPLSQYPCGSCWAFASAAQVEARTSVKYGTSVRISPQHLLDCVPNEGCLIGGYPNIALNYMKQNGYVALANYPYVGYRKTCPSAVYKLPQTITNVGYNQLNGNEEYLKNMLAFFGPVVVLIFAMDDLIYHTGGIYMNLGCPNTCQGTNHAVLLVGYGRDTTSYPFPVDYWIVKNSWGAIHENKSGYFRIIRNFSTYKNHCNIACNIFYTQ